MTANDALGATFAALGQVPAALAALTERIARLEAELAAMRRALPPQLVTLRQAAEALGVSYATVRRRARDGSLPTRRVGRALRVDLGALHAIPGAEVVRLATAARRGN